jgi:hypothetical protein
MHPAWSGLRFYTTFGFIAAAELAQQTGPRVPSRLLAFSVDGKAELPKPLEAAPGR